MLPFLDAVYTIAHIILIGFIMTGWIWRRIRKTHFIVIVITLLSWFGLGIRYGWGYCFLTDWHWEVKEKLGQKDLPSSFVKYFVDRITHLDIQPTFVDFVTIGVMAIAVVASVYVNFLMKS